jgi:hypothetical protein
MKGTLSAEKAAFGASGRDAGGAVATACAGAAGGDGAAAGDGCAIPDSAAGGEGAFDVALGAPGSSSLVKYKKPATPIATTQTTVTARGHIQFGVAAVWAVSAFFSCGVA